MDGPSGLLGCKVDIDKCENGRPEVRELCPWLKWTANNLEWKGQYLRDGGETEWAA